MTLGISQKSLTVSNGPDQTRPDRTGPDQTGLDWTGLDWTGLDWIGPNPTQPNWTRPDPTHGALHGDDGGSGAWLGGLESSGAEHSRARRCRRRAGWRVLPLSIPWRARLPLDWQRGFCGLAVAVSRAACCWAKSVLGGAAGQSSWAEQSGGQDGHCGWEGQLAEAAGELHGWGLRG